MDPAKFLYMKSPGIAEELITVSIKSSKVVNYVSSNLEKIKIFSSKPCIFSCICICCTYTNFSLGWGNKEFLEEFFENSSVIDRWSSKKSSCRSFRPININILFGYGSPHINHPSRCFLLLLLWILSDCHCSY